jgi:hypothetical protein
MVAHVSANRAAIASSMMLALTSSALLPNEIRAAFASNVTALVGGASVVSPDTPPPSPPIGAIVGGVVGGVLALGLVVAAVYYARHRALGGGTVAWTPFHRKYAAVRELGRGAFGVAYLAEPRGKAVDNASRAPSQYVVIKSSTAPIDAKAMREVDSLAKVRSRRLACCAAPMITSVMRR